MKFLKISVFLCFFGCLSVVESKDEKVCGNDNATENIKHCDQNSAKSIKQWWKEMSSMEPVKCNLPSGWYKSGSPYLDLFTANAVPVYSYPCDSSDVTVAFKFDGKMKDGQLHGLGHLELDPYSSMQSEGTCLKINRISGLEPVEIVGTFSGGTLQGNCKIILENGAVVVANFHNGLAEGLRREWNEKGELSFLGFYQGGSKVGKCWYKVGKWFVYEDCSTSDRSDAKAVAFSADKFKPVLSGNFLQHISSLDNIQQAKLTKANFEDKSCLMRVEVDLGNDLDFFYDLAHDQAVPKSAHLDQPLCHLGRDSENSPSENLQEWFESLDELMMEKSGHQILMMLKPEESDLSDDVIKIIENIELNEESIISSHLQQPGSSLKANLFGKSEKSEIFVNIASIDSEGKLHGYAELVIAPREKVGFGFSFDDVISVRGNFVHGELAGLVVLELQDFRTVYLSVNKNVAHGPAIIAGVVPILPTRLERPLAELVQTEDFDKLGFIGRFKNGKPSGTFWLRMIGGGLMHGQFDDGQATGDNLAFIYPDLETAFQGRFENFVMKEASEAEVEAEQCTKDGLLIVSKYNLKSEPIFYYHPPTNESFGAGPVGLVDPYELKWVEVEDSSVPDSGQGVFARRDIPQYRCTSMYSGLMFNAGEQSLLRSKSCDFNRTRSMEERRHCSKYTLTLTWFKTAISIPPEMDGPEVFHPTIGPKVNHHFRRNNSAYTDMEHPRWGSIMCVQSRIPIKAGQEIFTFYGYQEGTFPNDFPWYFDTLKKLEAEEREEKERRLKERPKETKIKIVGRKPQSNTKVPVKLEL